MRLDVHLTGTADPDLDIAIEFRDGEILYADFYDAQQRVPRDIDLEILYKDVLAKLAGNVAGEGRAGITRLNNGYRAEWRFA